ncbi:unnamed protein product [Lymnaea stagnalis]|uniref:MYND-type domain-containing protein n=1 Tax=Lymnaea stagnalis TaxID=6523 RepID=A0AAV2INW4_LYMST
MNRQAEAKAVAKKGHQKNGDSILSDAMQRGDRHDQRKPLADITGKQQAASQLGAPKKRKNGKQYTKERQTARPQTASKELKSEHGGRSSSSGRTADSRSAGKKPSKKQILMRKKERALTRESNKIAGTEVILYDAPFAQRQKEAYLGRCCVCRREQYSMKSCSRCGQLKYCSRECLHKHCKDEVQKQMCTRVVAFTNTRNGLKREVVDRLFASGITEISPYLYSVPRQEIYEMLDGPIKAVILQILEVNFDWVSLNICVQDISGQATLLRIESFFGLSKKGDQCIATDGFRQSIKPGQFLLLVNGHWNYHTDSDSAAIDIADLQYVELIPGIK